MRIGSGRSIEGASSSHAIAFGTTSAMPTRKGTARPVARLCSASSELVAEAEDLLGVVQHHAPGLGQYQAAALALEEVHAEIGLQGGDLARQGLRCQPGTFQAARTIPPARATVQKWWSCL